jgi:hypothetical protein
MAVCGYVTEKLSIMLVYRGALPRDNTAIVATIERRMATSINSG